MAEHFLARFAEVECCDIVTTGRVSGRPHEIEIWFGVLDDTMYLVSGNGESADWFRNMQAHPAITVKLDDEVHAGVARVVTDPGERERVGDLMGAKFRQEFRCRAAVGPAGASVRDGDLSDAGALEILAENTYSGDPSIGLTYEAWCYEVPAVAVDFPRERPR